MAVYTHFGSMPGLVREVMREGFERFRARAEAEGLERGTDPVAELAGLCRTYQEFARAESDVYAVMFGGSALAGFELSDDDRRMGTFMLRFPRTRSAAAPPPAASGRTPTRTCSCASSSPPCTASPNWSARVTSWGTNTPDDVLAGTLRDFAVAAGDTPDAAAASVAAGLTPRP